ncbi:ABC transporter ATP-binding protein [Paenibacillus sp. ACRRX]|uniref:ABC transporter ATP-binding protein n=1 Tax=Paenibacillus sp. ACRRX TaxID=2918206 RepID=UPI001EF407DA|nr:ABC transporter ATP-binding protein [Paenibacillus sp. ACRRX]MCG7409844.1 ABC transporter ATP-binding protein [Paenibacillus sp. ACRRX]
MIQFDNVSFRYGHEDQMSKGERGVEHISFSVKPGQCLVLCGRSGCGKSTILRLVNGLAPSFFSGSLSGTIRVSGQSPSDLLPEARTRLMGVVFQDPRSQFFMDNVRDELAFSAENLGIAPHEIMIRINKQAAELGISHLLDRSLNQLSSGQKQLVAITAASVLSPPLLILDEPTANLDHNATQALLDALIKLKQAGTTLVISEHRLHALIPVADTFVYMEEGRISDSWTKDVFLQLTYSDIRSYGLRHPDMSTAITSAHAETAAAVEPALEARKLAFHYRRNGDGIYNLNITLPKGSVTALTGENGAGKTTLCKILCGLLRQRGGTVLSRGIPLSTNQRRASSYLVMQDADYQLYADSVGNEIMLGRQMNEQLRERAYAALDAFGLRQLQERHPASLSGGEKQRVTMAAAYCSDAELIVLDEPTSGLDGDGVLKVALWARQLAEAGKTVIMITHDLILAELACDQVIELSKQKKE